MPFWKKTDKGGKKKPPKPAVPRTAQQSIPMQRMFEDGTCRVKPNYYTRTIQYQDINYQLAQQEDKTAIFEESTTPTPKRKRQHCSPKYAPAMCASCWAARQKWAQEPMCSSVLWQCIIWMSAGNPVI